MNYLGTVTWMNLKKKKKYVEPNQTQKNTEFMILFIRNLRISKTKLLWKSEYWLLGSGRTTNELFGVTEMFSVLTGVMVTRICRLPKLIKA